MLTAHGWPPEREIKWHAIRTGAVPPELADAVVASLARAPLTCYVTLLDQELGIEAETLPIACLTVRDDPQVKKTLARLRIPLFSRIAEDTRSIRSFLDKHLPSRQLDEGER